MSKKPYPHFENEEQELAWLSAIGPGVDEYMSEPTAEDQKEFARFLAERPDEEATRKPITVRMKLRDIARLKGLARKLDTKYQTLMMELVTEGLDRREADLKKAAKQQIQGSAPAQELAQSDPSLLVLQLVNLSRALEEQVRAGNIAFIAPKAAEHGGSSQSHVS